MRILEEPIKKSEIISSSQVVFDDEMVKGVVDLGRSLLAIDSQLHADLEEILLSDGSSQYDLWGINLYPDSDGEDFVEFDSMINIRPSQGNRSRYVENPDTRRAILEVVEKWVQS